MKLGLTKSQLGYYFWPKDLKHFEPDIFINYGNGCVLKFYTLQSIKAVKEEKNIPLRDFTKRKNTPPRDTEALRYIDPARGSTPEICKKWK
jgi:hypothetical protein